MKKHDDASIYFDLMEIQEGIFFALRKNGTGTMGNAGFINLGDKTIVFDSFLTPRAAKDLRKCAEQFTNQEVKYLVNSHYHFDHVLGNEIFNDVPIISTKVTRDLIEKELDFSNIDKVQQEMVEYLKALQLEIESEHDLLMIHSLSNQRNEVEVLLKSIPEIHLTLPTTIFEEKLVISGSKRDVELYSFGRGHTDSDTVLYLPKESILFAGDLILNGVHPWLGNGHISDWIKALIRLNEMEIDTIIPGHGLVGDKSIIKDMIDYLNYIEHLLDKMVEADSNQINVRQYAIPELFKEWGGTYTFYNNITALLALLNKNKIDDERAEK